MRVHPERGQTAWVVIAALAIVGVLIFFTNVNLTQKQAVITMFGCLIAFGIFWFIKKPWK